MTVGLTSGPVFPGVGSAHGAVFINNGTAVIAICPASVNVGTAGVFAGFTAGVAAINGAGSVNINPGDKFFIDNMLCTSAWNGIAASAGGALTVLTF
jgi:hypothetical protein